MTIKHYLERAMTNEEAYRRAEQLCTCNEEVRADQQPEVFGEKLHVVGCPVLDEYKRLCDLQRVLQVDN